MAVHLGTDVEIEERMRIIWRGMRLAETPTMELVLLETQARSVFAAMRWSEYQRHQQTCTDMGFTLHKRFTVVTGMKRKLSLVK